MLSRDHGLQIMRRGGASATNRHAAMAKTDSTRSDKLHSDSFQDDKNHGRRYHTFQYTFSRKNTFIHGVRRAILFVCITTLGVKWTDSKIVFRRTSSASSSQQGFGLHPIMVQVPNTLNVTQLYIEAYPPHFIQQQENLNGTENEPKEHNNMLPSKVPDGCQVEEWVYDLHPSCLDVHGVDMGDFFFNKERREIVIDGEKRTNKIQYLGRGGMRVAIMFHDGTSRRVIKTRRYTQEFDVTSLDRMRRDAVISEQLTASPYIADIYGYCGQASLVDFGHGHNLGHLFIQEKLPTKTEVFQIAADVAQSVADASLVSPKTGRANAVHHDLKPSQWIRIGNRWVLNDFNLARFLVWNPLKQENCHVTTGQFLENTPGNEKRDVVDLGAILKFLLTNKAPWEEDEDIKDDVLNGSARKILDTSVLNSTHPYDIHVRKAMMASLIADPEERPHAQQVANFLREKLHEYQTSKTDALLSEVWGEFPSTITAAGRKEPLA